MRSLKIPLQLAILLVLSLAAFPVYRGHAQISPAASGSTICVTSVSGSGCPVNVEQVVGGRLSVGVVLNGTQWLTSYSVTVNYDRTVIGATGVHQGNWAAGPCEDSGLVVPCGVFTITNSSQPGIGTLTVTQALLGSSTNITSSTLITIDFSVVGFGASTISIGQILLGGLVNGQPPVTILPTPAITNGHMFTPPPASAALIKSKIQPALHKVAPGGVQTLEALVTNTGTTVAFVRVDFTIVGADGTVLFLRTGVLMVPVGLNGQLSVAYTVGNLPEKEFVVGNLMVSGDGVLFVFSGSSKTFSFAIG